MKCVEKIPVLEEMLHFWTFYKVCPICKKRNLLKRAFFLVQYFKGGIDMADSNITKRALAEAMKLLMCDLPFDKITVAHICEKCDMNRKSFYYHFKDKYDLVNWIYDTEFICVAGQKDYETGWDFLSDLCYYLDRNRTFYRKALKIKGQNSFTDHFAELLQPVVAEYLEKILDGESGEFQIMFFADAFVGTIKRWIMELDNMNANEFLDMLKITIERVAKKVIIDMAK